MVEVLELFFSRRGSQIFQDPDPTSFQSLAELEHLHSYSPKHACSQRLYLHENPEFRWKKSRRSDCRLDACRFEDLQCRVYDASPRALQDQGRRKEQVLLSEISHPLEVCLVAPG